MLEFLCLKGCIVFAVVYMVLITKNSRNQKIETGNLKMAAD